MKRLIAAAVLFAVVLTAYFTGYFYIKNVCKEAEALLEECVAEYNANENALKSTEKLKRYWDKKEKMLSVFSSHSSIDEIEVAIYSLQEHSNSSDTSMFNEYTVRVKILIHQLLEDTVPTVHSVL